MALGGPDAWSRPPCSAWRSSRTRTSPSRRPSRWPLPRCSSTGRRVRQQIADRVLLNYGVLRSLAGHYPACRVLPAEGGWSAVVQVPAFMPDEERAIALARNDGRAGASRLLLRLRSRRLPRRQPPCAARRSSAPAPSRVLEHHRRHDRLMTRTIHTGRTARRSCCPLFSMPSTASWGIGEIGDLEPMTAWLRDGRARRAAAAADQRDGARPDVAVLGDQRDGASIRSTSACTRSRDFTRLRRRSAPDLADQVGDPARRAAPRASTTRACAA